MAVYFLDTSAIVKRYFQEQGHEWIETLHDPAQGHELYIAPEQLFLKALRYTPEKQVFGVCGLRRNLLMRERRTLWQLRGQHIIQG